MANKNITINLNNITGKQIYEVVKQAMVARSLATGEKVRLINFCAVAGLSRATLHSYGRGGRVGHEGAMKIAAGLKAWGFEVDIIF